MVDNAILHEQKLRLSTENKALHAILNKVEAGEIIDGVTLDDPLNTLMIVNSRLQNTLKKSWITSCPSI